MTPAPVTLAGQLRIIALAVERGLIDDRLELLAHLGAAWCRAPSERPRYEALAHAAGFGWRVPFGATA